MTTLPARLLRCQRGGGAAEFAMVLPVLLFFLLGTVDVGRLMWTWNKAEKATQVGVRFAVVTDMVPSGLATYDFVNTGGWPQGSVVPETAFGGATCQSSGGSVSCACHSGATCPPLGTANTAAFTHILNRMQRMMPELTAANLKVDYGYSGLGFAGDPNGSGVAPLVTVSLQSVQFTPLLFQLFGAAISLPPSSASMTLEDGSGTTSN